MSLQKIVNDNLVRYMELVPGKSAFIDARTPGSDLKDNFCIIGSGVAENSRQHVHIKETSGFNIGGAGQPPGIKNSLHSHRTAELFIVFKGQFRFYWGNNGENEAVLSSGDIISIPVNLFRGFEVVGRDYGFMFSVLGGDDAGGGVIWHPDVIKKSQGYGLYLKSDGTLADTVEGDQIPDKEELMPLLSEDEMASFDSYTLDEMSKFIVLRKDYTPSKNDFSTDINQYSLTGHPDAEYDFQVKSPDKVSIMGYELLNGCSIPLHNRKEKEVLINYQGDTELCIDWKGEQASVVLTSGDVFNVPEGAKYSLRNLRKDSLVYCIIGEDKPKQPQGI